MGDYLFLSYLNIGRNENRRLNIDFAKRQKSVTAQLFQSSHCLTLGKCKHSQNSDVINRFMEIRFLRLFFSAFRFIFFSQNCFFLQRLKGDGLSFQKSEDIVLFFSLFCLCVFLGGSHLLIFFISLLISSIFLKS